MTKPRLILIFLFSIGSFASAQKTKSSTETQPANTSPQPDFKTMMAAHYEELYKTSLHYGDFVAASEAVLGIISMDTTSIGWKDTLASLMYARNALEQCKMLAKQVYDAEPNNLRMLELLAASEQGLGNAKEALDYYEKLYPQTKQLFHLYQIATLQFGLQRLGECQQSLQAIISDENSEKEKVAINVGQGYQQEVPYKAAALNIAGVIARGLNDNDAAKKAFEDALKVFPDFVLAKGNLDDMNKPASTDGTKK